MAYVELSAQPPAPASSASAQAEAPTAARANPAVSLEHLRRWCSKRLPASAVPSVITVLEALPRSAAGKLARGALPPPAWSDAGLGLELSRDSMPPSAMGQEALPPPGCSGSRLGSGPEQQAARSGRGSGEGEEEQCGGTGSFRDGRIGLLPAGGGWEARVLRAFAEALGLPRLEPAADFYASGGDSLAAAAAASSLGIDARQASSC